MFKLGIPFSFLAVFGLWLSLLSSETLERDSCISYVHVHDAGYPEYSFLPLPSGLVLEIEHEDVQFNVLSFAEASDRIRYESGFGVQADTLTACSGSVLTFSR